MRLLAQWMIITYHILLVWFFNKCPEPNMLLKAMWVPLHIAVPCYVIVSGYFGIKFSLCGLLRIIAIMFVYGFCLYLIKCFVVHDSVFDIKKAMFFVSNTNQWFVRTYLFLYLLAPLINKVLRSFDNTNRVIMLIALVWMNCWCGFMGFEQNLSDGKNIIYFIFLYVLGNSIYMYRDRLNSIATYKIVITWLSLSVFLTIVGYYSLVQHLTPLLFNLCFAYNSIVLVLNAVLFFMLFMRMHFKSEVINYAATSSLAIYMLHMFLLRRGVVIIHWIQNEIDYAGMQLLLVVLLALLTLVVCIIIDKLLSPCWTLSSMIADKLNKTRIGEVAVRYNTI